MPRRGPLTTPSPAAPSGRGRRPANAVLANLPEAPPLAHGPNGLTVGEAARVLDMAECTVRQAFDRGKIPGWRARDGRRFCDRAFVEQLAAQFTAERATQDGAR